MDVCQGIADTPGLARARIVPGRLPEPLQRVCMAPDLPFQAVFPVMQACELGLVLLGTPGGPLVGVLTDSDVRRALIRRVPLKTPCAHIAVEPLVAKAPVASGTAQRLMANGTTTPRTHLIVVDEANAVVDVMPRSTAFPADDDEFAAVVMAGGQGSRLRPLTNHLPKPMLPIGSRPLLERIVEKLQRAGARRVHLTTHYHADLIAEHFGDGSSFGVKIGYVNEEQPLGTAGALSLLNEEDADAMLVMNGDILTGVDFQAMLAYHRSHHADLTVAVRQHEVAVPYGVMETEGAAVTAIREKPVFHHFINAGIYILNRHARRCIPRRERFDMPDLIRSLLFARRRVVSFPIYEYWLDVGHLGDYKKAQEDVLTEVTLQ